MYLDVGNNKIFYDICVGKKASNLIFHHSHFKNSRDEQIGKKRTHLWKCDARNRLSHNSNFPIIPQLEASSSKVRNPNTENESIR